MSGDLQTADFVLHVDSGGNFTHKVCPRTGGGGYVLEIRRYGELVTVYYRSGHVFAQRRFWQERPRIVSFPIWRFEDFDGFDVMREKPDQREAPADP